MSESAIGRGDPAFIAALAELDVGSVSIADDGFIGVIGHTGLSMRVASPDHLDTVRVWAALRVPEKRLGSGRTSSQGSVAGDILDIVNVLNGRATSGARYFYPGAGTTGNLVVAEAVIVYADACDGSALAHAVRLFELDVNAAVRSIARACA